MRDFNRFRNRILYVNWQKRKLGKCLAEFLKGDLVVGHPNI
ncbi:hypothetical protein HMPREF1246_1457 [Acidaminococcus sp. BV3L6]|nr:hypothetical protein HMPREF1246_1457 [Acidaminococcus sp. BV3L6]